jgi:hypothetical protein
VKARDYYGENYKKLIKQKDPHEEYWYEDKQYRSC